MACSIDGGDNSPLVCNIAEDKKFPGVYNFNVNVEGPDAWEPLVQSGIKQNGFVDNELAIRVTVFGRQSPIEYHRPVHVWWNPCKTQIADATDSSKTILAALACHEAGLGFSLQDDFAKIDTEREKIIANHYAEIEKTVFSDPAVARESAIQPESVSIEDEELSGLLENFPAIDSPATAPVSSPPGTTTPTSGSPEAPSTSPSFASPEHLLLGYSNSDNLDVKAQTPARD